MISKVNKNAVRKKRHDRMRHDLVGSTARPRLNVYRSLNNIYAQIIDDRKYVDGAQGGITLASASTLEAEIKSQIAGKSKKEAAYIVGKTIGERAKAKGITTIVFDRGGYRYMGRVEELAKGAREAGLEF